MSVKLPRGFSPSIGWGLFSPFKRVPFDERRLIWEGFLIRRFLEERMVGDDLDYFGKPPQIPRGKNSCLVGGSIGSLL